MCSVDMDHEVSSYLKSWQQPWKNRSFIYYFTYFWSSLEVALSPKALQICFRLFPYPWSAHYWCIVFLFFPNSFFFFFRFLSFCSLVFFPFIFHPFSFFDGKQQLSNSGNYCNAVNMFVCFMPWRFSLQVLKSISQVCWTDNRPDYCKTWSYAEACLKP